MKRLIPIGLACMMFGTSAHALGLVRCEGKVEGTAKGIIVGECNFLEKSQLQKGCSPRTPCHVKSAMNRVLKTCQMGSHCHIEAKFGSTFVKVYFAQRYDSSYGYEQRGFIPPDPVPRALRDHHYIDNPISNRAGSPPSSHDRRVQPRQERPRD